MQKGLYILQLWPAHLISVMSENWEEARSIEMLALFIGLEPEYLNKYEESIQLMSTEPNTVSTQFSE